MNKMKLAMAWVMLQDAKARMNQASELLRNTAVEAECNLDVACSYLDNALDKIIIKLNADR